MIITTNNYSVQELINMIDRRELLVNKEYQRGSGLWPPGPSGYFIDTILAGYPFPKIYMYEYLDRGARTLQKEIVDGQQRINSILRFFNDKISVTGDSEYAGKKFSELDEETQDSFLSYTVSVDVIRNATPSDILQMFRRMNAYTLPLNEAEKRHSSFQGEFKWAVNHLTDDLNEFFVEFGVFTSRQIVRMADAELIADCILAIERGVVSTSPTDLTALYRRYDADFGNAADHLNEVKEAIAFIASDLEPLRRTHMMKPYALHSLITSLVHNRRGIAQITEKFSAGPLGRYATNAENAAGDLLALAQAHEAKEEDGPHGTYVWGCSGGTNRAPRRTARVAAVLRALGANIPADVDDDLA